MKLPHSIAAACTALFVLAGCSSGSSGAHTSRPTPSPSLSTTSPSASPTPVQAAPKPLGKLLKNGAHGVAVETLQTYLYQSAQKPYYVACGYDGAFGPNTKAALQAWQKANGHKPTGKVHVHSTQWRELRGQASAHRLPASIDPRSVKAARQKGWAVDASKDPGCVNVLKGDPRAPHGVKVTRTIAASYGGYIDGAFRPTSDGVFAIYQKEGPDFRSSEWHNAPMPWAAFFHGGEAFHYDPLGASHGCVHIPSMAVAKYIHDRPMGTTVVVHA